MAIVSDMILLFAIIGILTVCSLPVIGFELNDRLVPEGRLWISKESGKVFTATVEVSPYNSQVVVRATELGNPTRGAWCTTDKMDFRSNFTRIPKKDEPLYLLANTGV